MSTGPGERRIGSLCRAARARLAAAGVETAALDARLLVAAAAGVEPVVPLTDPDREMTDAEIARALSHVARRADGEPVGRILGLREFWGLTFALSRDVLEPRPDSERLVEAVLDWCEAGKGRDHPYRFADLGTGSGAIAIALLSELPNAVAVATDMAADALATARDNALRNGVGGRFLPCQGDFASMLAPGMDFLVSNPPYISLTEESQLSREVREHDPRAALFAGEDGLDAYRVILPQTRAVLDRFAPLFLEIGASQAASVAGLAKTAGLEDVQVFQDLAGLDRVVRAACVAK
ncbi:peptide chain release factor N(5)-glutamine methyltransferase [Stappia indica]|uniref:peptide chain release factor N(5)-glutamine methyltransferase n=1 Tax=Stappia indica TaxID=538381 RepID=UPI00082B0583|nr:peptide chain release factor N(5)-glutamine methyltransferase [Stappia indica]